MAKVVELEQGRGTTSPGSTGTTATGWTTYTPQQAGTGEDIGKYLRVVASYTEAGGRGGQRAIATSMYPTIQIVGDNNPPSFTEGAAATRPVREKSGVTNIGARVAATNPESGAPHNEKLTYWLSPGTAPLRKGLGQAWEYQCRCSHNTTQPLALMLMITFMVCSPSILPPAS